MGYLTISSIVDKPFFEEFTYISLANFPIEQKETCRNLVASLMQTAQLPDVLVDLQIRTPELSQRITGRGREFEGIVSESWLDAFQKQHELEFLRLPEMNMLFLDSETYDFRDETQIDLLHNMIIESMRFS